MEYDISKCEWGTVAMTVPFDNSGLWHNTNPKTAVVAASVSACDQGASVKTAVAVAPANTSG